MTASSVLAIPSLQLDIKGGNYIGGSAESTFATKDVFTLYALLIEDSNPHHSALLSDKYYISAALVPKTGPTDAALGSFVFDGTPVKVTDDMVYGVPPIELNGTAADDPHDLPDHGIFDTFFSEFQFMFSASQKAKAYNVADPPLINHAGPAPNPSGSMYYAAFVVDTSLLQNGYAIHFDLYNTVQERTCTKTATSGKGKGKTTTCVAYSTDVDINSFAPFSHDAQSGITRVVTPEPGTLLLLGSGLAGLGLFGRKKKANKV